MSLQQVRMGKVPVDRIQFLRALRLVGDLELKPAMRLAEYLGKVPNSVVAAGLDPEMATHIAGELRKAGAEVAIEGCTLDTPMLCCPSANVKFEWSFLRRIKRAV